MLQARPANKMLQTLYTFARLSKYNADSTGSRLLTEVKQRLARIVLRWVTTWESRVCFFLKNDAIKMRFFLHGT
jgi:hypothetical protein